MSIEYPTWMVKGSPTPYERLVICPKCGKASWACHHSPTRIELCRDCPNRERMREATPEEYKQGKAALEEII